jgi:hypothetical protein
LLKLQEINTNLFVPLLVFLLRKKSSQPLCGVFHPQHVRQQAPTAKVRYFLLRNVLNINNINTFVRRKVAVAHVVGGKHRTTARQDYSLRLVVGLAKRSYDIKLRLVVGLA